MKGREQHDLDPGKFLVAPEYVARDVLEYLRSEYGGVNAYLDSIGFDEGWRAQLRKAVTE